MAFHTKGLGLLFQVASHWAIASNASTGAQYLTLSTQYFTSNQVAFTVGDPTPVITSVCSDGVCSDTWNVNAAARTTTIPITISGHGFGTNPTLTISGISGTCVTIPVCVTISQPTGTPTDTQIQATVTIDGGTPSASPTITVQSNGYNGSGFLPGTPSQPGYGTATVTVVPGSIPPTVLFNGVAIGNATQSVVSGQQIALTLYPLPSWLSITAQFWTNPPGTVVSAYTPGTKPTAGPGATNGASLTFYWLDAGNNRQITYQWTLNNGTTASETVTFNVAGPNGASVTTDAGSVAPIVSQGVPQLTITGVQVPESLGEGIVGILFQAVANLPPVPGGGTGAFQWVQVLNGYTVQNLASTGPQTVPLAGSSTLDNSYPYPGFTDAQPSDTTWDWPAVVLNTSLGEIGDYFSANMYLMWTSGLANSIPINLGYVQWSFSGDVVNTLAAGLGGTTWVPTQVCNPEPQPSVSDFVPTSVGSYPTWTGTFRNGKYSASQ